MENIQNLKDLELEQILKIFKANKKEILRLQNVNNSLKRLKSDSVSKSLQDLDNLDIESLLKLFKANKEEISRLQEKIKCLKLQLKELDQDN